MKKIAFSVIIPLYNKAPYISKAVHSVIDQKYQEFELIIVNDGSTDNSLKVLEQLCQKLKLQTTNEIKIISQENSGVSTARNNGVKVAKHDYIAFLDADDWWGPDFLKEMNQTIEMYPYAGIYGSNYYIVKNNSNKKSTVGLPEDFTRGYIDYYKTYSTTFTTPFNCSFVVLRKDVFREEKGFRTELRFGEDFELWIRIALKHKIGYCNMPLAYSNQDVPISIRALGSKKWNISEHYIFNLDMLEQEEKHNTELKTLLDGQRVRSLQRFYLNGWHKREVKKELKKIDFFKQPVYFKLIYNFPKRMVIWYFKLRLIAWRLLKD